MGPSAVASPHTPNGSLDHHHHHPLAGHNGYHTPSTTSTETGAAATGGGVLDTTMEYDEDDDDNGNYAYDYDGHNGQPPQQPSPQQQQEQSAVGGPADDEFAFNAPSYYDLKHPEMEQRYINNADGYFSSPSASPQQQQQLERQPSPQAEHYASPQLQQQQPRQQHQHASPHEYPPPSTPSMDYPQTPVRPTRPSATTADRDYPVHGRTPQIPYGDYRQPQREEHVDDDGDMAMADLDEDVDDRMSDGGRSDQTLDLEETERLEHASLPPPPPPAAPTSAARSHTSSQGSGAYAHVPSKLFQPTQSYLRRLEAEQAARDRHLQEVAAAGAALDASTRSSGHSQSSSQHRLTQPKSPRLRTSYKATAASREPKLSSTSRELQRIQEEKMRVQLETMKIRELYERTRAQRPPANVHQRSTKQLTVPQSPFLAVDHRGHSRRGHLQEEDRADGGGGNEGGPSGPHPFIPPEQFFSRDFVLPAAPGSNTSSSHSAGDGGVTVPHPPRLRTSARAAARGSTRSLEAPPPAPMTTAALEPRDLSRFRVNGVTRAAPPQLETDRRAQQAAAHRRPLEVIDRDAEELARKFHARPVNRKIFAPPRTSPTKTRPTGACAGLTQPVSPKFATSARAGRHVSAYQLARQREEEEAAARERRRQQQQQQTESDGPRRPVVPETPPLRSLYRHQLYQEQLRQRQEEEEATRRRQREFRARPIRVASTPPRFEGSSRPLTEVQPFALRSEQRHELAQERLERLRREEDARLRAAAQFKATPMPAMDETLDEALQQQQNVAVPRAPPRPLTRAVSPQLASDRRAAERAAFDAAERERRRRDEEQKRQMDEERRRREEEEIKRIRREQLTFHARPAPSGASARTFEVKAATKPLTEPESPFLHTRIRGGGAVISGPSTTAA